MSKYDIDQKRKDALQEYYFIEDLIDRFDQRSLLIKSWSITFTSAVIAVAVVQKAPFLLIVATFSSLVFWYLEAMWKYFQKATAGRAIDLEKIIELDIGSYNGPRIASSFRKHYSKPWSHQHIPSTLWYANVLLPHIVVSVISFIIFIYYSLN